MKLTTFFKLVSFSELCDCVSYVAQSELLLELVTRAMHSAQYQGSGVTTGKNADCAAISTLFVTICWPLWTPGQGEEVRRDAGSSRAGNRADNLGIRHHQPRPVVNNMSKTWGIMLYFISGPRPRILIIRICYHCCSTIISYDSCVKLCYGHNDQNV